MKWKLHCVRKNIVLRKIIFLHNTKYVWYAVNNSIPVPNQFASSKIRVQYNLNGIMELFLIMVISEVVLLYKLAYLRMVKNIGPKNIERGQKSFELADGLGIS